MTLWLWMSGKRNVSVCRGHELANALYGWIGNINSSNEYTTNWLGRRIFTIGRINMGAALVIASVAVFINVYPPQQNFEQSEDCSLFTVRMTKCVSSINWRPFSMKFFAKLNGLHSMPPELYRREFPTIKRLYQLPWYEIQRWFGSAISYSPESPRESHCRIQ